MLVNTCGFIQAAKQDSIDELLGAAGGQAAKVVAAGCLAERYGSGLAEALPEAQVLSFDDYARHRRAASTTSSPASGGPLTSRGTGASCSRSVRRPGASRRPAGHATSPDTARPRPGRTGPCARGPDGAAWLGHPGPARGRGAGLRPAGAAPPARRRPGGAAQDRLRLRPAVQLLRHPGVPRGVRLPPGRPTWSPRPAGWPSTAPASCSWSARTPPPTARTWATCGCWRSCCRSWPRVPGIVRVRVSYLQPAEVRPGLIEVHGRHARGSAVLRPVVPARQRRACCARCAGSATASGSAP